MNNWLKIALCSATAVLAACGGGGGGTATPATPSGPQAVSIKFGAVAGIANTAVNCSTALTGLGSTSKGAQLADLRFYVTNVQLVNDQGVAVPVTLTSNAWQYTSGAETVTLIDLEDGTGACAASTSGAGTSGTNSVVTGTVPAGNYVKLKATIGVPEAMNHSDPMMAPPPLDRTDMGWSWQNGYKFIKFELNPTGGTTDGTTPANTYSLHIASTNCTGGNVATATCANKNLAQFTLDFNQATQQVVLDVAELLNTTALNTYASPAVGCMSDTSDADCTNVFPKLGLTLATGGQAGTQTVFRVIAKN